MDTTRLNKVDLRRADLTGAVLLNNRDDDADIREETRAQSACNCASG
jgi:uncharacterized protein YjbI with pentapeptide repeats